MALTSQALMLGDKSTLSRSTATARNVKQASAFVPTTTTTVIKTPAGAVTVTDTWSWSAAPLGPLEPGPTLFPASTLFPRLLAALRRLVGRGEPREDPLSYERVRAAVYQAAGVGSGAVMRRAPHVIMPEGEIIAGCEMVLEQLRSGERM